MMCIVTAFLVNPVAEQLSGHSVECQRRPDLVDVHADCSSGESSDRSTFRMPCSHGMEGMHAVGLLQWL